MDFTAFFNQEVFTIGEITIKLGRLIFVTVGVVFLYILGFMLLRSWLDRFFLYEDTTDKQKNGLGD